MKRLDLVLIARHPELSRRKAQEIIEKGQVTLGGVVTREPGVRIPDDAALIWDPNRRAEKPRRLSLRVLYEDEHVIVIDKPAGLLTVPSSPAATGEDTVMGRLQSDIGPSGRRRRPFVGIVHRLDRSTSGALLIARDPRTRAGLRSLFRAHRIERRYAALVTGTPRTSEGTINLPIRDAYLSGRRAVAKGDEPARDARTHWRLVEPLGHASLLEVSLDTGRQHQIRIHLAHLGLPVAGDHVYGRESAGLAGISVPRPLLHARLLGFAHPLTGRPVRVESPLPADFVAVLRRLRATARLTSGAARPPRSPRSRQ